MPGRTSVRAAAWAASPARIERRRVSISSGSFDRLSGRISGLMSTISRPGRDARRPSTTPDGTPASSTPTRRPGIFASRPSAEATSWPWR